MPLETIFFSCGWFTQTASCLLIWYWWQNVPYLATILETCVSSSVSLIKHEHTRNIYGQLRDHITDKWHQDCLWFFLPWLYTYKQYYWKTYYTIDRKNRSRVSPELRNSRLLPECFNAKSKTLDFYCRSKLFSLVVSKTIHNIAITSMRKPNRPAVNHPRRFYVAVY